MRWHVGLSLAVTWSILFFSGIGLLDLGSDTFRADLIAILLAPPYAAIFVFSDPPRKSTLLYLLLGSVGFCVSGFVLESQLSVDLRSIVGDMEALGRLSMALLFNFCALTVMIRQSKGMTRKSEKDM